MNQSKAHEVEQGLLVENGPFYTGGTASPVGQGMPTNTFYVQNTAGRTLLWQKFGAGDTAADWRLYPASDVSVNVASLTNNSPDLTGVTTTQGFLDALSLRNFGRQYGIARQNPNFQTTVDAPAREVALSFTIPNAPGTKYVFLWQYRANNSKENTSNITEARVNTGALVQNNVTGVQLQANGAGELFIGFADITKGLAPQTLTFDLAIARTGGNGTARINTMNIFGWRLE